MNIFVAMLQALLGRKNQQQQKPDFSDRMERFDRANRHSGQRVGKSQGAPSQRMAEASRQDDGIMSNPLHPLNPLSPISIYNSAPSEPSRSDCSSDFSSSSSSSYDSGSSSCDSGSSSGGGSD